MSSDRWLFREVEIDGRIVDCRVSSGLVVEVAKGLAPVAGEFVVEGRRGALIPGLADHHVHLFAIAAARVSIDLGGAASLDGVGAADGTGWLRVIGAGAELRREDVDARWNSRPVRVQHRSGVLWTLNSAAVELLGAGLSVDERDSGQIWRGDDRLRALLRDMNTGIGLDLDGLGVMMGSYGVTHVTDASPNLDAADIEMMRNAVPQKVVSMSAHGDGPRKIVLDERDVDFAALCLEVVRWHGEGRPVAIHAVAATTVATCIAAFSEVGSLPGDRIEHAALCGDEAAGRLAELGVVVVTQPTVFARHSETFLRDTAPDERALLWRHAGLQRAGVQVVVSSDAPYGELNPARTIRAATVRPVEGVRPVEALRSYLLDPLDLSGPVRAVATGHAADLCLLDAPLDISLASAGAGGDLGVRATYVSGRRIFAAE